MIQRWDIDGRPIIRRFDDGEYVKVADHTAIVKELVEVLGDCACLLESLTGTELNAEGMVDEQIYIIRTAIAKVKDAS